MTIRAKFRVETVLATAFGTHTITMQPHYDETVPEDHRFFSATPTGKFEMMVDNPAVVDEMKPGRYFYIDMVPVDGD